MNIRLENIYSLINNSLTYDMIMCTFTFTYDITETLNLDLQFDYLMDSEKNVFGNVQIIFIFNRVARH